MAVEPNCSALVASAEQERSEKPRSPPEVPPEKNQEFGGGEKVLGKPEDALPSPSRWARLRTTPASPASPSLRFRAAAPRPAGPPEANPEMTLTSGGRHAEQALPVQAGSQTAPAGACYWRCLRGVAGSADAETGIAQDRGARE